jgi:predicted phage-related endonuclease
MKNRDYLRPSSLGSYFGVGFNTPEQQLRYDLGLDEQVFDEDAKARLELGKQFEETILDYFESRLNIIISDRNTEVLHLYGGKLHGKIDGRTTWDGEKAIVEAKMSNSEYKKFTDNMGYYLQCQSYMMDDPEIKFALLLGLQNGRPVFRAIPRDEEAIADIKEMTDYVLGLMVGLEDWENYPTRLVVKYAGGNSVAEIDNFSDLDQESLKELYQLNQQIKELETKKKTIEDTIKISYSEGTWSNGDLKLILSLNKRAGAIDLDALVLDNPHINIERYRKEPTVYKTMRLFGAKK